MLSPREKTRLIETLQQQAITLLEQTGWMTYHDRTIRDEELESSEAVVLSLGMAEKMEYVWLEMYALDRPEAVRLTGRHMIFDKEYVDVSYWRGGGAGISLPKEGYGKSWRIWNRRPTWRLLEEAAWTQEARRTDADEKRTGAGQGDH